LNLESLPKHIEIRALAIKAVNEEDLKFRRLKA
jgi:hypothetical protein